jgi:hypothetical protein
MNCLEQEQKMKFLFSLACAIALTAAPAFGQLHDSLPADSNQTLPHVASVEPDPNSQKGLNSSSEAFFNAIESKQLDVKVVALGPHKANFILVNKTDKPLDLHLPDHFAAVPVLGQFGGQFGGGQFGGQNGGGGLFGGQQGAGQFGQGMAGGQGGGSQAIGGGFNQNGGNGAGNGLGAGGGNFQGAGFGNQGNQNFGGAGFFRVEPGKSRKVQADMVCLEYGKQDPNPRIQYAIVPLNKISSDPAIQLLCKRLANGTVSQNIAQAIAWHQASGLSWENLAKINRSESHLTGNQPFFTGRELNSAMRIMSDLHPARPSRSLATNEYPN